MMHFVRRRPRLAVAAGVLLLVLFVVAVRWLLGGSIEHVVLAKRAAVAPSARPAVAQLGATEGLAALVKRQPGPNEAEVCGVGILDVHGLMDFISNESGHVRAVKALLPVLAANPNPRAQATGLYLQINEDYWNRDPKQQRADGLACDGVPDKPDSMVPPACQQAREREAQRWQASQVTALAPAMQLAQLAMRSADPAILSLAYSTCYRAGPQAVAACQQGLLEQWAAVDADNAQPWLYLLNNARQQKADGAAISALHHLSLAKTDNGYIGMMLPWIARDLPAEQHTGEDHFLLELATNTMFAAALPPYSGLAHYCSAPAVQDANRRQVCSAVVELLAKDSSNLIGTRIANRLGQGLGWPQERVKQADLEYRALQAAYTKLYEQTMEGANCAAQGNLYQYMTAVGQVGEMQAMRRAVLASGKTMEQLVQDYQRDELARKPAAK